MRLFLKVLGWLLTPILLLMLVAGAMVLQDRLPLVRQDLKISAEEGAWTRQWLLQHRPASHRQGQWVDLDLSERQLDLIANALMDKLGQGRADIQLGDGQALIQASLALPWDLVQGYLNLECILVERDHQPSIESARLAGLPLPSALIESFAERAMSRVDHRELVRDLVIAPDRLTLSYAWRPDLLERIGSGMLAEAELPLLLRYQEDLDRWAAEHPRARTVTLADLMSYLFSKAGERPAEADPIRENRAVLMVLAAYVNGQTIRDPDPASDSKAALRPRTVVLRGRPDLSQHFVASAAIAIQGNDTFSSLIGWYKEMSDSKGGSGFSFPDMAANRSGIRLAKLATETPEGARQIQRAAKKGLSEDDFMPRIDGLPEGMNRGAFIAGYGEDKARLYREMIAHIDRRIDDRPLYHQPSS
ncbi:hypothetical protein [Imhoffiella purpurea]|uniref:Uncharacterized protein n=1 Tax=Imhoffiella purpurea TaxID=1249627 RepID=W9V8Y3_9GAMM|nr:hypothetical protein [Imhoffiella purpurea]EXJ15879.1 hypothetical protein D779_0961 [Imhoffiella purpurea]